MWTLGLNPEPDPQAHPLEIPVLEQTPWTGIIS